MYSINYANGQVDRGYDSLGAAIAVLGAVHQGLVVDVRPEESRALVWSEGEQGDDSDTLANIQRMDGGQFGDEAAAS